LGVFVLTVRRNPALNIFIIVLTPIPSPKERGADNGYSLKSLAKRKFDKTQSKHSSVAAPSPLERGWG